MMSEIHKQLLIEPLSEIVIEYRGPPLRCDQYNRFFNPNICHVCKSRDNGDLISCESCDLISYCNEEHRKQDYEKSHGKFCKIFKSILITTSRTNREIDWSEWIQSRKQLVKKIKQKLLQDFQRRMKKHEMEMIWWTKVCIVCHGQNNLQFCKLCLSVNYCSAHEEKFHEKHIKYDCVKRRKMLNIDIVRMTCKYEMGYKRLFCYPILHDIIEENQRFCITKAFLLKYFLQPTLRICFKTEDYIMSDYMSGPLTIYFGLEKTDLLSHAIMMEETFIIHVIDVDYVDIRGIRTWEILFHTTLKMREIIIVFIGPGIKLPPGITKTCVLCNFCIQQNKRLYFTFIPMLYSDYLQISSYGYKKPNIIVTFGEGSFEWNSYSNTVNAIKTRNCPLFLSCSSKEQTENIMDKMKNVMGRRVTPLLNYTNPCFSLLPYRDIETGDISFRNCHVVVYFNLY